MRHALWSSALALSAAFVLTARGADEPLWVGAFANANQSRDGIEAAIETAVSGMNFVTRPIARSRLRKTNTPYSQVVIARTHDVVSVAFDGQAPVETPADGRAIKWKRSDGEVFDVSAVVRNDALIQTFKAEDGQRVNTFTANSAGQLTMEATITSPQLAKPVIYTLLYERAGPTSP
jgi:hypothetical protein